MVVVALGHMLISDDHDGDDGEDDDHDDDDNDDDDGENDGDDDGDDDNDDDDDGFSETPAYSYDFSKMSTAINLEN